MQIYIRNSEKDKISEIIFAENNGDDSYVLTLEKGFSKIKAEEEKVYVATKTDALNLIKALQKAIELRNWDE